MDENLKPFLIFAAVIGAVSSIISVLNYLERKECNQ